MPLSVLNWQVEIDFKVDGGAHNLYGDGFAIWLAKDRGKLGPVFGSVGESCAWISCLRKSIRRTEAKGIPKKGLTIMGQC